MPTRRRSARSCPVLAGTTVDRALPGGLTNRNYTVHDGDGRTARARGCRSGRARCWPSTVTPSTATRRRGRATGVAPGGRRLPARTTACWSSNGSTAGPSTDADLRRQRDAGAGRRSLPAAARRPAVRQRLRHVRTSSGATSTSCVERGFRLPAALPRLRAAGRRRSSARWPCAPTPTVPCHNDLLAANIMDDGEPAVVHRLRVRRQQRPVLRARQHLERGAPRPGPARASWSPPTTACRLAGADRPGPAARADVQVRLDAVGLDPGRRQRRRLRLLVVGHGEVRPGRRRVRRPGLRHAHRPTSEQP